MDNFDPLLVHIKAMCKNADREFAGALLRPHGGVLRRMLQEGISINDILDAAREAGRQLVAEGKMSAETLRAVSRKLIPQERLVQKANQFFRQVLNDANRK
jgi:hypothetical protein